MKQVELTPDLKLETVVQQMNGEDIVLTRQGHAVALLSDFDDDELYWAGRERDPAFVESLRKAREEIARGKTVSHEDLKKQLGIK